MNIDPSVCVVWLQWPVSYDYRPAVLFRMITDSSRLSRMITDSLVCLISWHTYRLASYNRRFAWFVSHDQRLTGLFRMITHSSVCFVWSDTHQSVSYLNKQTHRPIPYDHTLSWSVYYHDRDQFVSDYDRLPSLFIIMTDCPVCFVSWQIPQFVSYHDRLPGLFRIMTDCPVCFVSWQIAQFVSYHDRLPGLLRIMTDFRLLSLYHAMTHSAILYFLSSLLDRETHVSLFNVVNSLLYINGWNRHVGFYCH